MAIHSPAEFYAVIGQACANAVDYALEKAYDELLKTIDRKIYSTTTGMATHTIPDAWKQMKASGGAKFHGELEFNPARMANDPANWVHGSMIDHGRWSDVRSYIIDILEDGYFAYGNENGNLIGGRPFWDEYIAQMDSKIPDWFKEGLAAQGLTVV